MIPANTAVWLYGSFARGDNDEISDFDMLVVGDDREVPAELATRLARLATHRPSLSIYTWTEIEGMSSSGSLFLHHLRAEGQPLFEGTSVSGRLRSHLDTLKPYTRAPQDVETFKVGLREARHSVLSGGSIPFELSVIATLVRHSSILGCYVMGQQTFGRISPVELVTEKWGLGRNLAVDFSALYSYKLLAERRVETTEVQNAAYALEWCDRLNEILLKLEVAVEQYVRSLPTAAPPS